MTMNVAQKLIQSHLVEGVMTPGKEIALKIDQTLTQDATGTLVMLELEAMGITQVKTEHSVQYVDHNLIQEDFKNPDDHLFLQSACQKFGIWFSRPGNGVSHPIHMQYFGKPTKTLLGSDSHTCAAGSMGMLAMGAGGLEVAMAMAGYPYYLKMPKIFGIKLTGKLADWVSAKDVILEMLKRHSVKGGVGCILEYYGPGLQDLSAMDRHVIANMGAELGATATVFPSDEQVKAFLTDEGRAADWEALEADKDAQYDLNDEINLSTLVPLIARPSSPDNVVAVEEIEGEDIYQAYIGSSANPGYRDFAISALMIKDKKVAPNVSYDINPSARSILEDLANEGHLTAMIHAGARLHQAGCNGCIGMGQAPATGKNSLRTTPRNFPGRSGTMEDSVFLCSPETATASAITGKITDPRKLGIPYPKVAAAKNHVIDKSMLQAPVSAEQAKKIFLIKGPNIASIPKLSELAEKINLPILLKVGDNISTDTIMPAGGRVLPYRSNIPKISEFVYDIIDKDYHLRAQAVHNEGGHIIIGGENYGQGSSREHAALAPRYLGLHVVVAKSFARIHLQNLVNFGILPLTFCDTDDYEKIGIEHRIVIEALHKALDSDTDIEAEIVGKIKNGHINLRHDLSKRQIEILKAGGLINWVKQQGRCS